MPAIVLLLLRFALLLLSPDGAPAPDARQLMARYPPAEMERRLAADRTLVPSALGALADALAGDDPSLSRETGDYLAACARARSRRLGEAGRWQPADVEDLVVLQLVHPERFATDAAFRRRVLDLLPRALDPGAPAALRDDLLAQLEEIRGIDFAASEAVESAWGAVPRRAADREVPYPAAAADRRFGQDTGGAIAASVYSLPSTFFGTEEAVAFLAAVRAAAPGRAIAVLTDLPLRRRLEGRARELDVRLLETYGRPYSPWPRDPFSLVRTPTGGVLVLVRPNVQPGREEDAWMGRELVQDLPADLDRAWGGIHWATAPVPFHNGQVLLAPDAAWITLHTLEPRILALLGLSRVPVEAFETAAGIDRYLAAARQAADELAALYGRPVRFVHPLPKTGPLAERSRTMRALGGGAGYDLDSLVTLLGTTALVADIAAGRQLLAGLSPEDATALARGYGLEPRDLGAALRAAQTSPAAAGLDGFLAQVAERLKKEGMTVRRLPLVLVPVRLLRDREGLDDRGVFLLTWNNVVVETRGRLLRAEGFSSLLPAGDRQARETFAAAGCRLDLFPPLTRSIVLNGGYRCASNHVREKE
jgi:hypothetical protein